MSIKNAIVDVIEGAKNYQFWITFGMNSVKSKYRRSKLGQLWITLSVAIFILVIGALYSNIFSANGNNYYTAYLAIGYILWQFIQESVNVGCQTLISSNGFMMQKSWPVTTFVFRTVYREILFFAHHAVLFPIIFLMVGLWPGFEAIFFSFLGFMLTVFASFWVVLFVSIISLRYRDFPPIVQSLLRMAFFATPIIWIERDLGTWGNWIITLNPFSYFIKIVRDPLLGYGFPSDAWLIAIGLSIVTMLIAIVTLSATKSRLTYWL